MNYTLNFYLRSSKRNDSPQPIYLFISFENKKIKLATGEKVLPQFWNAKKQEVKNKSPKAKHINPNLILFKSKIENILEDPSLKETKLSGDFIREKLNPPSKEIEDTPPVSMIELYDSFLADILVKVEGEKISIGYLNNLKALRPHLLNLARSSKYSRKMPITEISPAYAEDLKLYFNKNHLKLNTIDKHFRSLKRFLKWAKTRDYIDHSIDITHPSFKTKKERVEYPALSEEELKRIKYLDLSKIPRLGRVRDQFTFLCEQGLRFSDLQLLKVSSVKSDTDEHGVIIYYLDYRTQKTNEHVIAPLSVFGKNIIDKYLNSANENVFPSISNQKFNLYLKEIARLAEVDKDISSHTGRRTFITLCIERGMDLESIAIHTGHRSMDELFRYWKKSKMHRLKKGRLIPR